MLTRLPFNSHTLLLRQRLALVAHVSTLILAMALSFAVQAQAFDCSDTANCEKQSPRFEVGMQSLKAAQLAYPAAALAPQSLPGWQNLSNVVESAAPKDEGASTLSSGGVKLDRRTSQSFPTEPRNLFSEVDKVMVAGDLFPRPMDYNDGSGVSIHARQAIKGQNTWMLWGEGNEAFWGWLQQHGYGIADFLVLLDSRNRDSRFATKGLINQPGMAKRTTPIEGLGLYLDQADGQKVTMTAPQSDVDIEPRLNRHQQKSTQNREAYPAAFEVGDSAFYANVIAQLANDGVDPLTYGYPSGVVGLRLMPNPDFFGKSSAATQARQYWQERIAGNAETIGQYYASGDNPVNADPALVRPFRVAMACSFCHIAAHPLAPPADAENPEWGNLSSTIGNQYWRPETIFSNLRAQNSFLWQFVASQQPGTIDTSLISTDHINNPNTINALFEFNARLARAGQNLPEQQSPSNLRHPASEDAPNTNPRHTPRVLLDGSDSIGVSGALSRVYLNIGAYSEQWNRLHNPVIGFRPQRPFELATVQNKSVYWQATEAYRIPQLEAFFTYVSKTGATVTQPMKLGTLPEGRSRLEAHRADAALGRQVFLTHCAVCHSSKQPIGQQFAFAAQQSQDADHSPDPSTLTLPMRFADWERFKLGNEYRNYLTRLFAYASDESAQGRDFFADNYLSTDVRVPVTLVGTNSQRAVATNAMRGQVWDNFSSDTYKQLPAIGQIRFFNPFRSSAGVDEWGNNDSYAPPAGGPGYYRPASLVGIWATAPFLHNNSLGLFNNDPSVAGRLQAYDDAIDRLLYRDKRSLSYTQAQGPAAPKDWRCAMDFRERFTAGSGATTGGRSADSGLLYRTTTHTWIDFPASFIRPLLVGVLGDRMTSFLALQVWLGIAAISLLLAFLPRALVAATALTATAAIAAALLRVIGLDNLYPWLWAIPAVGLALACWLLVHPHSRRVPRLLFATSALVFLGTGLLGNAFVNGHLGPLKLGPIPKGTPINLLMNVNPQAPVMDLVRAVSGLTRGIIRAHQYNLPMGDPPVHYEALAAFEAEAGPALLKVSRSPDFVADRGHWFGEHLSDIEKRQLKAFLETF